LASTKVFSTYGMKEEAGDASHPPCVDPPWQWEGAVAEAVGACPFPCAAEVTPWAVRGPPKGEWPASPPIPTPTAEITVRPHTTTMTSHPNVPFGKPGRLLTLIRKPARHPSNLA
jgi:hypothetical protein